MALDCSPRASVQLTLQAIATTRIMDKTGQIDRTDAALLVFLSVLWGGGFVLAGLALKELPPVTVVFGRVASARCSCCRSYGFYRVALPRGLRGWMPFIVMGLLNNVIPFALIAAGQTYTRADWPRSPMRPRRSSPCS